MPISAYTVESDPDARLSTAKSILQCKAVPALRVALSVVCYRGLLSGLFLRVLSTVFASLDGAGFIYLKRGVFKQLPSWF